MPLRNIRRRARRSALRVREFDTSLIREWSMLAASESVLMPKTSQFNWASGRIRDRPISQQTEAKSLMFLYKREDHQHRKPRRFSHVGEEHKRTYTIRIPEQVAAFIEESARTHGIAPTTFIQSIINRKFKSRDNGEHETEIATGTALAGKLDTLRKRVELSERSSRDRFDQLRYEVVKTRATILHSLDQTLSATVVNQIIEASDHTAREYIAGIGEDTENRS